MSKIIYIVIALLLAGCASFDNKEENPSGLNEYDITLNDGRTLHCINVGFGTSCDWVNAE